MNRQSKQPDRNRQDTARAPSPAAGMLFMMGGLGFFYSLITIVDPLL